VAALMVMPAAVTIAPVASPPKLDTACARLGEIKKPTDTTSTVMTVARQDHCTFINPPCGFSRGRRSPRRRNGVSALTGIFGDAINPVYSQGGFVRMD